MIKAINLHKRYNDLDVLKGIDLEISAREILSIVGSSGAGKTTLLQLLSTLEEPTIGKVLFEEVEVSSLSEKKLAQFRNQNIGFIFQFHQLLPEFTALENAILPALIKGTNKKEAEKEARHLFELLKINHREEHFPNQLSGGEQQRVAVARALINRPKFIFADEPSGNLDSDNAEKLHELFFEIRERTGTGFVIVTHNEKLANMADRKLVMKDGLLIS